MKTFPLLSTVQVVLLVEAVILAAAIILGGGGEEHPRAIVRGRISVGDCPRPIRTNLFITLNISIVG